ncbi:MAG TPA: hypothetical protein VJO52_15020 [Gemmatimonadaceae bacterium]|nr:hypothetical protein [Gemmatimonadaceae bacterium]
MVAALLLNAADRTALQRALERRTPLRVCERVDALRSLVAAAEVRVVVTELRDRVGMSVTPVLVALAANAGAPAIVLRSSLSDAAAGDVLRFAATRVAARLSLRELEDIGHAVAPSLGAAADARAGLAILERVGPLVPRPLRAFVVLCAASSASRLHVARAAQLLGVGRRTLENRLARASLPAAHRVIGWCVALGAAWQLDVLDLRPKQVAAKLGFASGAALANLLARYGDCTPTSLRDHGGFQAQLERFAALFESARE